MSRLDTCSVYIHIPFCRAKCLYCDFNSCAGREADLEAYLEALHLELRGWVGRGVVARTLYVGGGTPSLLSPQQIEALVQTCRESFSLPADAEISMEANPGTVDARYLSAVRQAGVNRLSLGIQSFDSAMLRFLGRIHDVDDAVLAVRHAREAGFANLNLDLIYALPNQTVETWLGDLRRAFDLKPEHLSLYALSVEDDTPLATLVESGRIEVPGPDVAARLHERADSFLAERGYEHYEISNYARVDGGVGYRCRHNLAYWSDEPYLGFGAGAHSYFGGFRFWNLPEVDAYVSAVVAGKGAEAEREAISKSRGAQDWLMMGLRVSDGLDLEQVRRRYGLDVARLCGAQIAELEGAGLVTLRGTVLALTPRGRLLANEVLLRLIPELQVV